MTEFVAASHALGIFVIFDIVPNHTGDVFEYPGFGSEAPFSEAVRDVRWRDRAGNATAFSDGSVMPSAVASLFPDELRSNTFFRRRGKAGPVETEGDFASLKQMLTADPALGQVLVICYQYLIAKFDIDGYRIDTLKYLDPAFALTFGNAMPEFALTIGKRNFFTFGEGYDDEQRIAEFIGRHTQTDGDVVGVDAALDFPLFFVLPAVANIVFDWHWVALPISRIMGTAIGPTSAPTTMPVVMATWSAAPRPLSHGCRGALPGPTASLTTLRARGPTLHRRRSAHRRLSKPRDASSPMPAVPGSTRSAARRPVDGPGRGERRRVVPRRHAPPDSSTRPRRPDEPCQSCHEASRTRTRSAR